MPKLVIPCRSGFGKMQRREAADVVKNDIGFFPIDYTKYATRISNGDRVKVAMRFGSKRFMFPAKVCLFPQVQGKTHSNMMIVYFNESAMEDFLS